MMTNQKTFVHFFCLIKRNEPKKNQVRLKASTYGHRSKKQPNTRSPNTSLFVHYAAKRTNNAAFKTLSECARGPKKI